MSPRSEEFIEQARDRLAAAREALAAGHRGVAVSVAYYAMLYAARASLSEDDENARTHRGTWNLFRIKYITTDAFDVELFTMAQHAQVAREAGDYSAVTPSGEEAERYVTGAADFLAAVERMIAG
ncbi:MAG: HEPN domain-containing protein [Nitrososphaerota archaeon]